MGWVLQIRMMAMVLAASFVAVSALAIAAGIQDADVTLDNHWGTTLELWVDRKFGCRAEHLSTCTVRLDSGEHELQARKGEEIVAREFLVIKSGENFSYRVEPGFSPNNE